MQLLFIHHFKKYAIPSTIPKRLPDSTHKKKSDCKANLTMYTFRRLSLFKVPIKFQEHPLSKWVNLPDSMGKSLRKLFSECRSNVIEHKFALSYLILTGRYCMILLISKREIYYAPSYLII